MQNSKDNLTRYFREISEHKLLGRQGEVVLAKRIEEREITVWRRLLSLPASLPLVLDTLESEGMLLANFAELRRTNDREQGAEDAANGSPLLAETCAQLRAGDRDREYLGIVLAAIGSNSLDTRAWAQWRKKVAAAEKAAADSRQQFITSNLRFVVSMCRKYAGRGVAMEDLIQEGNMGLIKAVNRFEYSRGYRFSTYASWWIRDALVHAVACTSRVVRVPVRVHDENRQIARAQRILSGKLGREPSNEEIAEHCELSVKKVAATRNRAFNTTLSLDEPLGEDGTTRLDLLLDPANTCPSLLDELLSLQEIAGVSALLDELGHMQADVLRKRFGFEDRSPMTLRRIGEQYGLSRERIRQIQNSALQALRAMVEQKNRAPSGWPNTGLSAC